MRYRHKYYNLFDFLEITKNEIDMTYLKIKIRIILKYQLK